MCIRVYVCMYVCVCLYGYMCLCMCVCVYVCKCVCVFMCMYVYVCMCVLGFTEIELIFDFLAEGDIVKKNFRRQLKLFHSSVYRLFDS